MKRVIIASPNPVKMNAAQEAFTRMMPDEAFEFAGISAPSGVSDQPMGDSETYTGAANRVENAIAQEPNADFWVGIEGGVEIKGSETEAFAWVVVKDRTGKLGKGRSGTFFLPPAMTKMLAAGMELGQAGDIIFNETNSKQNQGSVGLLTRGLVPRTAYYVEPTIFALIPFVNRELF